MLNKSVKSQFDGFYQGFHKVRKVEDFVIEIVVSWLKSQQGFFFVVSYDEEFHDFNSALLAF